ncbi:MAG: hypothetical protein K8Q91_02470 [Candidatus Vogelbacteria bacterium]|jgi:hypothetical protein|nr:hypothetical protein [Candidatus Vogelbacteria bacterium]
MMLNEFSAKKLGEVLAFSRVGIETLVKGRNALSPILEVGKTITTLEEDEKKVLALADAYAVTEIVTTKAESTGQKLRAMRDLYVAEQWDNQSELLEWFGFFQGAAIVHWGLVLGVGEGKTDEVIRDLASQALRVHEELLEKVKTELGKIGKTKAVV